MTTTDSIREAATSMNLALLDGLFDPPRQSLSVAACMVQASPAAARLLLAHIESDAAVVGNRLVSWMQFILSSMITRCDALRLMNEIEDNRDEKMNLDAVPILAREEHNNTEKSP